MKENILHLTEEYVLQRLKSELSAELRYHNVAHTLSVREFALILGKQYKMDAENLEILEIAALLHDIGYVNVYTGHEEESANIAETFLKKQEYPAEKIERIRHLILATSLSTEPKNLAEEIIKDADMSNLGQGKYLQTIDNLRHELKVYFGVENTDLEFFESNIQFMDGQKYFTEKGSQLFDAKKAKNRLKVIKLINKLKAKDIQNVNKAVKKKTKKIKQPKPAYDVINGNKSAQMIFKTALRNHIDLTSIADNKANIMLSINALIITISLPLLASNINDNPMLMMPTSVLLITCVASIIYATLATRPIKTKGLTSIKSIEGGPTNLFFFGNFYRMTFEEYKAGVKMVIVDDNKLDDSIMSDLYYLGKALGNKFNQLRVCYTIFMTGITLTVIAFAVMFFIGLGNAS